MRRNPTAHRTWVIYEVYRDYGLTERRGYVPWLKDELAADEVHVNLKTLYRWLGTGVPDDRLAELDTTLDRCFMEACRIVGKTMAKLRSVE